MNEIIMAAIQSGRFDLTDLTRKIGRYHIDGLLTDEQRDALITAAREKANPHNSYGEWQAEIDRIWEAIRELQTAVPVEQPETPVDEYPAYVQPTGAHDAYPIGAKVTFNGKRYVSNIAANVWAPDVYPDGWTVVS